MSISPENAPQMPPIALLGGAFATSSLYALLLSTPAGRLLDRQHNWFVVMVGVWLTLLWLMFHDRKAAGQAFIFFLVTGLPIIARALVLDSEEKAEIANRSAGR